jgi:hypothetical protein
MTFLAIFKVPKFGMGQNGAVRFLGMCESIMFKIMWKKFQNVSPNRFLYKCI